MRTIIFMIFLFVANSIMAQNSNNVPNSYKDIADYKKINELNESFSDNKNGWVPKQQPPNINVNITDGFLNINNKTDQAYYFLNKETTINYENDFQIETVFEFKSELNNDYSLLWGAQNGANTLRFFEIAVSKLGYFKISKYNGAWTDYAIWLKSTDISSDFNKITVRKIDNEYSFFINENFVYSMAYEGIFGSTVGFQTNAYSSLKINHFSAFNLRQDALKKESTTEPEVYALVVGITTYRLPHLNTLRYCSKDAKMFYDFLTSAPGGKLSDDHIKLLLDTGATTGNILREAQNLYSKAKENDYIIFYFSGHGGANFFQSYNNIVKHSDLKNIIAQSRASSKLCIADACYSGTWDKKIKGYPSRLTDEEIKELYDQALFRSSAGLALFMSAGIEETSLEDSEYQQGLFTYFLLEGLKGAAVNYNHGQIITVLELYNYVNSKVVERAASKWQNSQTPQLKGIFDTEMIVGVAP